MADVRIDFDGFHPGDIAVLDRIFVKLVRRYESGDQRAHVILESIMQWLKHADAYTNGDERCPTPKAKS
jgi:hypothetical protein